MIALTRRQRQLLHFIVVQLLETGISPTYDEMMRFLRLRSKAAVAHLIERLRERGAVDKDYAKARGLRVTPEGLAAIATAGDLSSAHPLIGGDLARLIDTLAERDRTTPAQLIRDAVTAHAFRWPPGGAVGE